MINTFDVKAGERPTNVVCEMFNYFSEKKLNGKLPPKAFENLLLRTVSLISNCIRKGKMQKENIESVKSFITNLEVIFPQYELADTVKACLEEIEMAEYDLEQRMEAAHPVMEADSYERTFRRLGH